VEPLPITIYLPLLFRFQFLQISENLTFAIYQTGKYYNILGFPLDRRHREGCVRHTVLLPLRAERRCVWFAEYFTTNTNIVSK